MAIPEPVGTSMVHQAAGSCICEYLDQGFLAVGPDDVRFNGSALEKAGDLIQDVDSASISTKGHACEARNATAMFREQPLNSRRGHFGVPVGEK